MAEKRYIFDNYTSYKHIIVYGIRFD